MLCKICEAPVSQLFSALVINKYDAQYYLCGRCGFIQTSDPIWLKEAYKSPINLEDTGLVKRNIFFSKRTAAILFSFYKRKGSYLDFAGGNGLFVRLMRDVGYDFYWQDPFTENVFARGFEYNGQPKIDLITTFESFEHFTDPLSEIEKMLNISRNILFSTEIYKNSPPLPDKWAYYAFSHGQHISLYSYKTLKYLADKFKLNLYSNKNSFHLLTEKRLNNTMFNLLLKAGAAGLSAVVMGLQKSKTVEDSTTLGIRKSNDSEPPI